MSRTRNVLPLLVAPTTNATPCDGHTPLILHASAVGAVDANASRLSLLLRGNLISSASGASASDMARLHHVRPVLARRRRADFHVTAAPRALGKRASGIHPRPAVVVVSGDQEARDPGWRSERSQARGGERRPRRDASERREREAGFDPFADREDASSRFVKPDGAACAAAEHQPRPGAKRLGAAL